MPTKTRLLQRFAVFETERQGLLVRLDRVPHALLETPPTPGAWSVTQVLLHLALAEGSAMAYLSKKLEVGGHRPVGTSATFRLFLLNTALALPIRFKAPAIVAHVPPCTYATARSQWDSVRADMRNTFAALPDELVGHGLFKHPSAGKFDMVQGLSFMGRHVRHHRGQIERTLRQLSS